MIAWMIAAFFFVVCLALSWRVLQLESSVGIEQMNRERAEERAEHAERCHRRVLEINHKLASQRPMHFAGQPTLDATAYRGQSNPQIVWWTYDN